MDTLLLPVQLFNELRLRYEAEYAHWRISVEGLEFLDRYFYVLAATAILYLPVMFGIQRFMRDRKAYKLRAPLVLWNLSLVLFNVYACYYLASGVLRTIADGTFVPYLCSVPYTIHEGPTSHALFLFAMSKVPEMLDTLFIVLKKNKLIFLHWWHHITVMLFCWSIVYSARCEDDLKAASYGRLPQCEGFEGAVFGAINAFVHSIMYLSYGLKAMGFKPPGDLFITTIQLSQMVVGAWIAVYRVSYCDCRRPYMAWSGVAMYGSYFALFAEFFYSKYIKGDRPSKGLKAADVKPIAAAEAVNGKNKAATANGHKSPKAKSQ